MMCADAEVSAITNHTVVAQGETVVITCVGYAEPNVSTITWTFNGDPVVNSSLVFKLPDVGFVNQGRQYRQSRLQICSFYEEMVGDYGCTVSNGDITASATTELSLFGLDNVNRVAISEQTFVAAGNETAVLYCAGFGLPLVQLSWTHYDRPVTNSPSTFVTGGSFFEGGRNYLESFLHICGPDVTDSGPYTCVFTNQHVTVGLSTEVIVTTPPIAEVSAISDHMTINEGETTILTCVGYGKPDVEIMWTFNDENLEGITNTSVVNVLEESGGILKVLRLEICGARKTDSGIYTCTVINEEVSASAQTQLTIRGAEIIDLVVLSEDTILYEGETTLLSCVAFGEPSLSITWTFNNETVVNNTLTSVFEEVFFQAGRLFTHSFLQICSDNVADTGIYTCSITNGLVSLNASTQLMFGGAEAVRVIAISEDSEVANGDTAVLTCVTYNQAGITITWTHDDELVVNTSLVFISEESQGLYKQSFLQICDTKIRDYGSYRCIVSNGFVSAHADTIMSVPGAGDFELVLISNDTDILVRETIVLLCVGYGEPDVEITWSRNDQTLMNSSLTTILESDSFQGGRLIRQSLLEICDAEMADAGTYVCTVDVGHLETSYQVNLGVNRPPVTLEIPRLLMFGLNEGDIAMFQCVAQGSPLPDISWFKENNPLIPSGTIQITSGTRMNAEGIPTVTSILTVSDLTASDAGNYTCRAFNDRASVSLDMPYVLTVTPIVVNYCSSDPCQNGGRCISLTDSFKCNCTDGWSGMICDMQVTERSPPMVTTQPEDVIVSLRSRANFSCVASGNPNPAIQWFKDGRLLPGQTSSMLVIQQVSLNDRGFYYCTATNSEGVTNSTRAVLNIQGVFQFVLPVTLSVTGVGPFQMGEVPSDEVIMIISGIVDELKNDAVNQQVGTNPGYIVFDLARVGSVTTVSSTNNVGVFMTDILVTLLDSSGTPVPPSDSVLQGVADLIEQLGNNRQFNVQEESIRRFDACTMENETLVVSDTMRGVIDWTEGLVGFTAISRCPCDLVPVPRHASRVCGGDFTTGGVWMSSNNSACEFDDHAFELCGAISMDEVTTLSEDVERTTALGIIILTLNIEQNAVNASGNLNASNQLLDIIDNVQKVSLAEMKSSQEEFNSSSRIRGQLDRLLETYPITDTPQLVVRDMFGCSLYPDLGDAVLSFSPGLGDTIQLAAAPTPNLTITLPETLVADAGFSTPLSLAFCGFKSESLFVRRDSYLEESGRGNLQLASGVVSARPATSQRVTGLTENVKMTFMKKQESGGSKCSYWEQGLDGGYGGWSEEGCQLVEENGDEVVCECNHLTNFAVLSDGTPADAEGSIQRYTIIGAVVALLCALIVLFCVAFTSELRSTAVGVFLINLCIALLGLYITYIVSHFTGASENACEAFSFLFHYFVLVSCLALSMSAFFLGWTPFTGKKQVIGYMAAILLNWLFPLVVVFVAFFASGNGAYYPSDSADFCRPVSEAYWFGLLLVGGLFMLLTIVLLIIAPIHAKFGRIQFKASSRVEWYAQYFGLVAFAFFFFVAWGFGIPATHTLALERGRVIFQAIFIVCSVCQGVVMVACFCLLSKDVRQACCCGRIRVSYPLTNASNGGNGNVDENPYAMAGSEPGLLYQNPIADEKNFEEPPDFDDIQFDFGGSAPDKDTVKEDLGKVLEANDDETATEL